MLAYFQPRFDVPQPYPWVDSIEGGLGDKRFRYSCTSISSPHRLIGFARRRRGRGGRYEVTNSYLNSTNFDMLCVFYL